MGKSCRYPGVAAKSASSIQITFNYQRERCRETVKLEPTPANLKRAAEFRDKVLAAILSGTFDYAVSFPDSPRAKLYAKQAGDVLLTGTYLETWHASRKQRLKSSTVARIEYDIRAALIPAFGHLPLSALTLAVVRAWCKSLTCGNGRMYILLSTLRQALTDAVEDELVETNPLKGWTYTNREAIKEDDVDPFTVEEQRAILAALPDYGRHLYQFAFWTGMRPSELVALEWRDVDWAHGIVRVQRGKTDHAKEPEAPKTKAGRREIKLLPLALQALEAQRPLTEQHPSGRIWLDVPKGRTWTGSVELRVKLWNPALKQAGVRYRRPYQTRHTYASMMLTAGEHPAWLAKQMGHSNWLLIGSTYAKWMTDADISAGSKAAAMFGTG